MKELKKLEGIHKYWSTRKSGTNGPNRYRIGEKKSKFLVEVFEEYVPKGNKILELGCNVGRNLWYLQQAGYKRLAGMEINPNAVIKSKKFFPDLRASIAVAPIEMGLPHIKKADCIFTMAVLCHVHSDVEWIVFDEMMDKARRWIILFEDEAKHSRRHVPRDYREYFKRDDIKLVDRRDKVPGMNWRYRMSVFKKVDFRFPTIK